MLKVFCFIAVSVLALTAAVQAHAWSFTCGNQSISHKTLDYLTVSNSSNNFLSLRMSVNGQASTVPTLLSTGATGATGATGDNTYVSHDGDVEVTIDQLTDQSGSNSIDLKVKSLGIKGALDCQSTL